MLEDETVLCPICETELHIKINRFGNKMTYVVTENCPNCKTSAHKIERMLTNRSPKIKTEKSYIKLDPRG